MPSFRFEVLDSITKIQKKYWDPLFNDPIFSYDWLLSLEKSLPFQIHPRHIIVFQNNKIAALLPCFLQLEELYSTAEDRILGRLKSWSNRIGIKFHTALLSYSPLMYKSSLGIIGHTINKEVINILLDAMDMVARQEQTNIYGFNFLPQDQSILSQWLDERSFLRSLIVPNTYIDVNWSDFDGYIAYLKKHHRHMAGNVRREIRKSENLGIRTEKLTDFTSLTEDFALLFANTYYRHTLKKSPLYAQFFNSVATYCKDSARAYCAFKDHKLRSFSIFLEGSEIWHLVLSGQDYADKGPDYSYFNVFFYEPIKAAIEKNAKRIYFGAANYEAKMRRGCILEPLFMYFKSPKMGAHKFLSYWLKITEIWYKRKYKDILNKNDLLIKND